MMSAYSEQEVNVMPTGVQEHDDPGFLNNLLNSSYVACLSDPNCQLEESNLGALIVAAHSHRHDIVESAADAVLESDRDNHTMMCQLEGLPPQAPAHMDFHGNAGDDAIKHMSHDEPIPAARTFEETELEMLKIAVTNPDLYNNLRVVFTEHKYPSKLDAIGQQLRQFFINPKG